MPLQSRVPRTSLFPKGYRIRLVMMVSALVLIGATIYNLREKARPANAVLAAERSGAAAANELQTPAKGGNEEWQETIVPGPADDDPLEMEQARNEFDAVFDKTGIVQTDMFAYWRLMRWARSLSFADLQQRARKDDPFRDLWEDPESHRGELIRLRLHVRQVVGSKAVKNAIGVKRIFEVSGPTDKSVANPYVVVCFELPPGIPEGEGLFVDADFVGYFLKVWKYGGGDSKDRGAPLLIGRLRAVKSGKSVAAARSEGLLAMVAIGFAILLAALLVTFIWQWTRKKRSPIPALAVSALPTTDVEAWLENSPGELVAAVPSEAAGSGSVVTNGQANHADGPVAPDSTDHLE
jgi:hypothetical protein